MPQNKDVLIEFPNVTLGVTGGSKEGPQIIKPIVKTNGETHYDIIWMPKEGDVSYGGGYNDAKHTGPEVIIARTGKVPHVCIINVKTRKTIWQEDHDLLEKDVYGGVHSATVNEGGPVVCVPYSYDETQDNMVYISGSNPQKMQKIDFPDCHAAIWVNRGPGETFLWAVGRSTPPNASNAKEGKCLLRKYLHYGYDTGIKFELEGTFTLIENPQELDKLGWPEWWESPHDVALYDKDTLWISTDLQVIAFDLKNNKVLPSPISHDVFQSIKEIDTPSATNIKGLRIDGDCILYTQGLKGTSSMTEFYIVKNKKKYTFKIQDGGVIYKARWAYDL